MKKYLTMWQIWVAAVGVLLLLLLLQNTNVNAVLPFAVLLICPIMMIFMMKGHKH
ncbi:MAG: hypothetical protein G01um10145_403 [Microgenomates group bacterium Gr01-1014_5]|nr:MAG: hypothetical protein G01um10145_403 [Microgenomates group bacterium Gr01-1014_5]